MPKQGIVYQPLHRPSLDQESPIDSRNPPQPRSRRGSSSDRQPRLLLRRNSKSNGGQQKDAESGGRSWYRSSSTPPETRNRDTRPQDSGNKGLKSVSADDSLAWGKNLVERTWPGRTQNTQVQAQVQTSDRWSGQLQEPRGRPRRSSDASHSNPVPPPPPPKPAHYTPPSPSRTPTIPGITPQEMGLKKKSSDPKQIYFYSKHREHYGFTNFSPHPVEYLGKRYPTSEHLFQALKFVHRPNLMEHIRTCDPRPSMALSEARRFNQESRSDWGKENITAMDTALYYKFTQNRRLRRELLGTGEAELIEGSYKDSFWGCGPDGKGRNELGKSLMRLRKQLRERGGR